MSRTIAIKATGRLGREGLTISGPYRGVFLTEAGHAMARRNHRRHRMIVDLLLAIGVPGEAAEQDAKRIEHHMCAATLQAFGRFLQRKGGE